jgi:hypothetical protein
MKGVRLTRASGIDGWVGEAGTRFLVPDDVARDAVASGLLEYIPEDEHNSVPIVKVERAQLPDPDEKPREMTIEERYAEMLNADGSPRADLFEQEPEPVTADETPKELKKPYGNRPKAEWIAYAIQQGHDPDEAEGSTKADLMSLYGERL